ACPLALLRREVLPVPVVLEHSLAFLRGELLPALEVALDDGSLFRSETIQALNARRLPPRDFERGQHEDRDEQDRPEHAARRHFVAFSAGPSGAVDSSIRHFSSIRMRSSTPNPSTRPP